MARREGGCATRSSAPSLRLSRPTRARRRYVGGQGPSRSRQNQTSVAGGLHRRWEPRRGREPDVALRSVRTPVRQRFLVGATTNAAVQLGRAGRGLAASVVCDANDLADAAAAAGVHGAVPGSDERFRPRAAALAEHFSNGRHQRPASHAGLTTFRRSTCPVWANLAQKACGFPVETSANIGTRTRTRPGDPRGARPPAQVGHDSRTTQVPAADAFSAPPRPGAPAPPASCG
jgi:hypothetical protein